MYATETENGRAAWRFFGAAGKKINMLQMTFMLAA